MTKYAVSAALVGTLLATAMPVLAQTGATSSTPSNMTCVQIAVDAREQALGTAFSTFSTALSSALSTRASALHNAWGMSVASERRAARDAAWTAFRTASKSAHANLKTARNAAWASFKTASAACKVPVVESAGVGSGTEGL